MEANNNKQILLVLFIGVLMGALDIAIVGPALPAMKRLFQVDDRLTAWVFSIYLLFFLIGTPLMAKLSDTIGRRRLYIADILLFAVGSLVVALAPSFEVVLIGRGVQGLGAGGIFPVASALIGDTFPPERRGVALGVLGTVYGIAFIIGPLLGGILLLVSWRLLFLINIPLAALVVVLSRRVLPLDGLPGLVHFDARGILTLSIFLAALASGVNRVDTKHLIDSVTSHEVLPYFMFAVIAALLFVEFEKRVPEPVLRIELLEERQVRLAALIAFGAGLCEAGFVFIPAAVVTAFALRESTASFILLPMVAALSLSSPPAGRLLDRYGARSVMQVGSLIFLVGLFLIGIGIGLPLLFIAGGILAGAGFSALPARFIVLNEASEDDRTAAQGLVSIAMSIGQMLGGVGVGAAIASYDGTMQGYRAAYLSLAGVALLLHGLSYGIKGRGGR